MDFLDSIDWGLDAWLHDLRTHRRPGLLPFFLRVHQLAQPMPLALVAGALALALFLGHRRRASLAVIVLFVGGALLGEGLRLAIGRERPDNAVNILGQEQLTPSFPSRTVLLATLAFLAIPSFGKQLVGSRGSRAALLVLGVVPLVLVACSQLYLQVHWATDVFAALIAGGALVLLAEHYLFPELRRDKVT